MSLSTPTPNGLLSELGVAGNPYHGLVDNGTLTLPNATTMPHPAPAGTWYMSGRSIKVARPGWVAPTRTPEQQTADTAAGYQWLNYGVIAGESALFYGRELGADKWIYIDAAGDRWLAEMIVPLGQTLGTMQGANVTVRLARFGVFGADAQQYDYSVTVPDLQQTTPDWSGFGAANELRVLLMDVKPNGSGALFMAYKNMNGAGFFRDAALAFIEITLSGPGATATAAMVLRRNRAQCVGTVTQDPWPSISNAVTLNASSRGVVDAPIHGIFLTGSNNVELNDFNATECTGTIREVASLGFVKSTSWSDGDSPALPPDAARVLIGTDLVRTIDARRIGVIASMFYAPDGSLAEITADFDLSWNINSPSVGISSGGSVTRETVAQGSPGSCSTVVTRDDIASITYSKNTSVTGSCTITLKANGATCYQKTFSGTESGAYSMTVDYKAGGGDGNFTGTRGTQTSVVTRTYNGETRTLRSTTLQSSGWPQFSSGIPFYDDNTPGTNAVLPWHLRRTYVSTFDGWGNVLTSPDLQMYEIFGNQATDTPPVGEAAVINGNWARVFVQIVRMAPGIVGVMESTILNTDLGDDYQAEFSGDMATPGGAVSLPGIIAPTMIVTNNPYPTSALRATYHPVTGEVARSFTPVCWV